MKYSCVLAHSFALAVVRPPPIFYIVHCYVALSVEALVAGEYHHPSSNVELDLQERESRLTHRPS